MASIVENLLSGLSSKVAAVVTSTLIGGMIGGVVGGVTLPAQAQTPAAQPPALQPAEAQPPAEAPEATRTVQQSNSAIGIASGQALMSEAEGAIAQQNYSLAAEKLISARTALNNVSTYYQNLAGVFLGVDSRVNTDLRDLALNSAQVRDQATYQLAVVYRAQGRPELAIPLLVEVVQSQQPTRELGKQAYQQLYELGFVGVAYGAPDK
ncbi:MAG: hypothetical protein WBA76_17830 [Phormidesmis sp.]